MCRIENNLKIGNMSERGKNVDPNGDMRRRQSRSGIYTDYKTRGIWKLSKKLVCSEVWGKNRPRVKPSL